MPTTVTKSIGTSSRDYSTLQSWEDACPANLVSADQIWKGECYNDSEFSAGVTISGQTTDSTRYVWLTAAAGQSFQDNANVRTNALAYSVANGVGITSSTAQNYVVDASSQYTRIDRLQVKTTTWGSYKGNSCLSAAATGVVVRDCVLQQTLTNTSYPGRPMNFGGLSSVAANVVAIQHATNSSAVSVVSTVTLRNITAVAVSANSAAGVSLSYFGGSIQNQAVFNFASAYSGTNGGTISYWGTDLSSVGSGSNHQTSLTFANCFENTSTDFRLKVGSPLIGTGNTDATNAPNDISGTARDAGTGGDIGAWEYTSGGGGGGGVIEPILRARRPGVTWANDRGA